MGHYKAEREKMAEDKVENGAATEAAATDDNAPQVGVIAQYITDLSFESPNAPTVFKTMTENKPSIDVNVGVNAKKVSDESYEVELKTTVNAKHGDENAFMIELVYTGLFGIRNLPEEALQPFLLIQAPTILFPFSRRIVADASRDGGFPPLLLEPIDFNALYQHSAAQAQAQKDAEKEKA